MKIYNQEKMNEIRKKLKLEDLSYDEMCKFIFNSISNQTKFYKYNFTYIDEGSSRAAYGIDDFDVVVKMSFNIEDYDKEVCFQGIIEQRTFEQYKDHSLCYEIYGFSDNCGLVFCKRLEDYLSLETINRHELVSLYDYITNDMFCDDYEIDNIDEDVFNCYLENGITNYLYETYEYIPFDDIHINNVGIDTEYNELKILDLGYGDHNIEREILEELLIDGSRIIRGVLRFGGLEDIVRRYGGRDNKIVA